MKQQDIEQLCALSRCLSDEIKLIVVVGSEPIKIDFESVCFLCARERRTSSKVAADRMFACGQGTLALPYICKSSYDSNAMFTLVNCQGRLGTRKRHNILNLA